MAMQSYSLSGKADSTEYLLKDSSFILWIDSSGDDYGGKGLLIRHNCKGYVFLFPYIPEAVTVLTGIAEPVISARGQKPPLFRIKGNVLYDVNYRSRIDTPFAEANVYQHTIQTHLDLIYKDRYPFRLYLTNRFSNSSLFRKYTDFNFQYNQADFTRMMKARIIEAMESYFASKIGELDSIKRVIELRKAEIASVKQAVQHPDVFQKQVEDRERKLFGDDEQKNKLPDSDQLYSEDNNIINGPIENKFALRIKKNEKGKADSLRQQFDSFKDSIEFKKKKLDSLIAELEQLEIIYNKAKSLNQLKLKEWRKEIGETTDVHFLAQKLRSYNLPDSLLPKGYKTLSAIQSFGIGRSIINYSELSVKNVSITGLSVEYNPKCYYALAVGKVDYRFRDYIIPDHSRSNQYVALARFGKGMKNGNHLFFTYYTGRRQLYNSSVSNQPGSGIPEYNLAGITLEGYYKINRNTFLIAEMAKSTIPYYSLDSLKKRTWMHSVTKMSDRSNEAYSVKINSYLSQTRTRFTGSFRYMGANFQSFSTFTTGASQVNWIAKLEQPFFKRKVNVITSLQQSDYSNPFIATAYKSSSVLASFQANLRFKKWPVISLGYYPSYQLTKLNDDRYSESRYYSFVANAGYYYRIQHAQMSAFVIYTQFYNQASDSGFVYFNSRNFLVSQGANMKKLSVLLNLSISDNTDYCIYTIENSCQYTVNNFVSVGGGFKYNKQTVFNNEQWGYSGDLTLKIPRLGDFRFMIDKGFLPGANRQLVENKMGRLTYYKTF